MSDQQHPKRVLPVADFTTEIFNHILAWYEEAEKIGPPLTDREAEFRDRIIRAKERFAANDLTNRKLVIAKRNWK